MTSEKRTVQPIRNTKDIDHMKDELKRNCWRDLLLFEIGINTGLRVSDILPLTVADAKRGCIHLTEKKTGKERIVSFKSVQDDLNKYIQGMSDDAYLFASRKGSGHIDRIQAYRILNAAAKKCGLEEIGTHTLRKTFGYHFYQRTKDIATLMTIFNHSSQAITLRYIGITDEMVQNALENFSL